MPRYARSRPLSLTVIYFDSTFDPGDWQSIVLRQDPGVLFSVDTLPNAGNPIVSVNASLPTLPGVGTVGFNVARIRPSFVWNPAVDGPLQSMNFSFTARNVSTAGFGVAPSGLFWRPVILQGGLTYSVLASDFQSGAQFAPFSWNFTDSSDWVNFQNPSLRPDFSASGAPIQFGYRVQFASTCRFGCRTASINDVMDDFRVELRAGSSGSDVPEPGTWALMLVAATALLATRRPTA